jgi:PleD family two-component response regulator
MQRITESNNSHSDSIRIEQRKRAGSKKVKRPPPLQPKNNSDEITKRVLIVDDNVFNLQILSMVLLNTYKLKADEAVSGEEAIMKCTKRMQKNQDQYSLILMDINMPIMNGIETTKKLR